MYKLWGREPALWLGLISALVMAASSFGLDLSAEVQGGVNAASAALFGVLTAWFVARDGLQAAILGFAKAVLSLAMALGLNWPADRQSAVMILITTVTAMFIRSGATAPVDEAGRNVTERSVV